MRSGDWLLYAALTSCALLLTSHGASDDDIIWDGSRTRGCCWPTRFTAHLGRLAGLPIGGVPGILEEEFLLAFDYEERRWGFWAREHYRTHEYTEVIYTEDFPSRKWTLGSYQGCARMPIDPAIERMHLPCIPEYATLIDTAWMGEGDEGRLVYDSWAWDFNHTQNGEEATSHVVASLFHDSCVPYSEVTWWTAANFNYTTYVTFLDLQLGPPGGDLSPFRDLERYYDCSEHDKQPDTIDTRLDVFMEGLYLVQRTHYASRNETTPLG